MAGLTTAIEWTAALSSLELRLIATWTVGPALRERWTPVAAEMSTIRTEALAAACAALAARGAQSGERGSLELWLVEELSRSGALTRLWPLHESPLPETTSKDPDADLGQWREMRIRFALHQRLTGLVSGMTPGGNLDSDRKALLEAITRASVSGATPAISLRAGLAAAYQEMTRRDPGGFFSGIAGLDAPTGGLRPGHVWVLGAPTNWGKSSLLIAIAEHHLDVHARGVLIVTCEDSTDLLFQRWLTRRARLNGRSARDARLSHEELNRAATAVEQAGAGGDMPVMLDGRGKLVEQLVDDIRGHVRTHGIRLVLVDYLQCMSTARSTQDRRAEINHIARTLTDAIKTTGAAGLLASQITGEDIRESRDVEHAAEVVLIGGTSESGEKKLKLKKNKTGPSGFDIPLAWDEVSGSFGFEQEVDYGIPDADNRYGS